MREKLTNEEIEDLLGKMDWEGGLDGLVDSCGTDLVKDTYLEPMFNEYIVLKNKIENEIRKLEDQLEESEDGQT